MVDELRALFAYGARRQGIGARQRNLPDSSQAFWREKAQGAPVRREAEDRDFVGLQSEILADQFQHADQLNRFAAAAFSGDIGCPLLQFADQFASHGRYRFPDAKSLTAYSRFRLHPSMSHSTSVLDATPAFVHFRALKPHRKGDLCYTFPGRGIWPKVWENFVWAKNPPPQDAR